MGKAVHVAHESRAVHKSLGPQPDGLAGCAVAVAAPRLRVLTLARSYPNRVFPELGLWTAHPMVRIAETCDVQVVSPVPYFPPLPHRGRLRPYTRFRLADRTEVRDGVTVHRPRFLVGPGTSLYRFEARAYLRAVGALGAQIHAERPVDLVHAHFVYPDGAVGHELARRFGVPLVVTEHAPWTGWLERPGVRRPALATAAYAARIIAVSRYVRDSIAAYIGSGARIDVIPNGVDGSVYRLGKEADRDGDRILYVGIINFNKGIDVLLDAMAEIVRRRPTTRLELAGGSFYRNTRVQREELERRAAALGLGDRIRFLGHRPPKDVARLMAESGVVVLPSRAESFGSVLVEALACGTPVVASRSGGPEDIVDETVGKLVPKEDPGALAAALVSVLDERERYDPKRIRERTLRRFGWDAVVQQTLDVYRQVACG